MSDLFNLYAEAGSPNGDDQPQSAHRWAADEITTLHQKLERAEARVAELEEGLHGIANCAYGFSHPKAQTADEAASWMNDEAMRLLGDPQPNAYILRKQAEAVEAAVEQSRTHLNECAWPLGGIPDDAEHALQEVEGHAQRLRQQADAAEKEGGEG